MKLVNINVGIKINNSKEIAEFLLSQDADIINIQEIIRHLEDSVFHEYQSKALIEEIISSKYPYKFFGPLWITEAMLHNGQMHRDFGGLVEQGNEILSKTLIQSATNEHYYKTYSYARDWTNWKKEDHGRALIVSEIKVGDKQLQVLNIHGIWTSDKRGDKRTEDECAYLVDAALRKEIPTIIAGDFNLLPDTKSISIINKHFRNLCNEYNIKSTRPDFKDTIDTGNNVVDYIFVNNLVKVNDFKVINTDISDHLPLLLEFEI